MVFVYVYLCVSLCGVCIGCVCLCVWCLSMCVCGVCVYTLVCLPTCVDIEFLFPCSSYFFFLRQSLSLSLELIVLTRLSGQQPLGSIYLCPHLKSYRHISLCPVFSMGDRDPNLAPCACITSTVSLTHLISSVLKTILYYVKTISNYNFRIHKYSFIGA